jgi:L-aspartate oxidase
MSENAGQGPTGASALPSRSPITGEGRRVSASDDRPVIIGAGLAGLMAALHMQAPCVVLSRAPLGEQAASAWAQGGLAAAIGADDTPALHLADTLAAGDGLCDTAVARTIIEAGPALVDELARLGARFDRKQDGSLGLGLEAGHGRRRIVHAQGDASGREILRAVIEAARAAPQIDIREGCTATRLLLRDGAVAGVLVTGADGAPFVIPATRVVIATGGLGGLYLHSTNPAGATGQGLVLAARAGAALADLEFVQFHPTALDVGLDPMPLVSEAVRGEGATLIDEHGVRFMAGQGRAELEPRDIVSRAVWQHMQAGHRVFLDARAALGASFASRFPGIAGSCKAARLDPAAMPIPIRPAAHYHMGGIAVDARGRSTVAGLWACGEAASTGLHGANRLASNSLLEAAVTGQAVGRDIAGTEAGQPRPLSHLVHPAAPAAAPVRAVLSEHAGVLRDAAGLSTAAALLREMAGDRGQATGPVMLGLMMVTAMLRRQESRGGHARTDFPGHAAGTPQRLSLTWRETLAGGPPVAAASARRTRAGA